MPKRGYQINWEKGQVGLEFQSWPRQTLKRSRQIPTTADPANQPKKWQA
jgi:hypothetical protein